MLPDRSLLVGQKMVENAKIQKFKCDILIKISSNVQKVEKSSPFNLTIFFKFNFFLLFFLAINALHIVACSTSVL